MKDDIWLLLPHSSNEGYENKCIRDAFDTNWVVPLGPIKTYFRKSLQRKSI